VHFSKSPTDIETKLRKIYAAAYAYSPYSVTTTLWRQVVSTLRFHLNTSCIMTFSFICRNASSLF